VARQFGGTAETVSGSMQGLTDQVSQFLLTGQTGGFLQVFNALGVSLYDSNRQLKTAGQLFLDLNDAIQGMNPSRARSLLLAAGADPATVNMLLTNSKTLKDMLETQRQIGGTTDQSAEAAGKLQAAWQRIYTRVEEFGRKFLPMMLVFSGLAEFAMDWLANKISGRPMTPPPSGAGVPGGVSSSGAMNNAQIEAAIRSEARARGIDPDIAVRVWQSEGKGGYVGDRGSSFGPFQLHYGGVASGGMAAKGLGDKFTATTGLDARDPSTTLAQIRFSLDEAARGGWGPWHGWTGLPRAGLAGAHPMGGDTNTSHSTTNVNIGKVEVVTQATDGDRAARDFASTLERMKFGASANYGQR
jgi:hypothetical protein